MHKEFRTLFYVHSNYSQITSHIKSSLGPHIFDSAQCSAGLRLLGTDSVGAKVSDGRTHFYKQGMVDGSASKPALRQDTGYMVEKPYFDIAPYLGAFGAYLMPQ